MNVAGGIGCQVGDIPVYISAIRPESAVARCGKIQVRKRERKGAREREREVEREHWYVCLCGIALVLIFLLSE